MQKTRAIITAAALTTWILVAPAAIARPSRGDVPDPDPVERIVKFLKRIVKPLNEIVIPRP